MRPVLEKDIKISCSIFSCLFFLSLLELLVTHSTCFSASRIIWTKLQLSVSDCKYRNQARGCCVWCAPLRLFSCILTKWSNKLAKLVLPHFFCNQGSRWTDEICGRSKFPSSMKGQSSRSPQFFGGLCWQSGSTLESVSFKLKCWKP